jgi:hypothetical protein
MIGEATRQNGPWPTTRRRRGDIRKIHIITLVCVGVALLAVEASIRLLGLTNFPIFMRAPGVAYYPAPNQSGVFLNKNHWYVNAQGFENDRSFFVSHPSVLLVGDSIIEGGNPTDYKDRVGPIAAQKSGVQIWVGAAGGWRLLNELAFLKTHSSELRSVDQLIILLKDGDFEEPAFWTDELSFPTRPPLFATSYMIRRYFLPRPSNLPMVTAEQVRDFQHKWSMELDELVDDYHGAITIVLYPDKYDYRDGSSWKSDTAAIRSYVGDHTKRMKIVDVREDSRWNASMYRDGIHPNLAGDRVLGELIANTCMARPTPY